MKAWRLAPFAAICLYFLFGATALGQNVQSPQFGSCLDGALMPSLLKVDDQITPFGPKLEDAQLIALENGRKAVVFAVRNISYNNEFQQWNIRYSVIWHDECGRLLPQASPSVDGFLLHPNEYRSIEVVSFHKNARRASLRIYFEQN
jgi:uncharacterized protein YcfL